MRRPHPRTLVDVRAYIRQEIPPELQRAPLSAARTMERAMKFWKNPAEEGWRIEEAPLPPSSATLPLRRLHSRMHALHHRLTPPPPPPPPGQHPRRAAPLLDSSSPSGISLSGHKIIGRHRLPRVQVGATDAAPDAACIRNSTACNWRELRDTRKQTRGDCDTVGRFAQRLCRISNLMTTLINRGLTERRR
jgi:hypothetical protein